MGELRKVKAVAPDEAEHLVSSLLAEHKQLKLTEAQQDILKTALSNPRILNVANEHTHIRSELFAKEKLFFQPGEGKLEPVLDRADKLKRLIVKDTEGHIKQDLDQDSVRFREYAPVFNKEREANRKLLSAMGVTDKEDDNRPKEKDAVKAIKVLNYMINKGMLDALEQERTSLYPKDIPALPGVEPDILSSDTAATLGTLAKPAANAPASKQSPGPTLTA